MTSTSVSTTVTSTNNATFYTSDFYSSNGSIYNSITLINVGNETNVEIIRKLTNETLNETFEITTNMLPVNASNETVTELFKPSDMNKIDGKIVDNFFVIGIVIGAFLLFTILLILFFVYRRRRKRKAITNVSYSTRNNGILIESKSEQGENGPSGFVNNAFDEPSETRKVSRVAFEDASIGSLGTDRSQNTAKVEPKALMPKGRQSNFSLTKEEVTV